MKLNLIILAFTISNLISFDFLCSEEAKDFEEKELLEIYVYTEFIRSDDQKDIIEKYQLKKKPYLLKYKTQLSLVAKDIEKWKKFSDKAIDMYINIIPKIKTKEEITLTYYKYDGQDVQRRAYPADALISDTDLNVFDSYVIVTRIEYKETRQNVMFKAEYYKENKLNYVTYFCQKQSRPLKTLYYEDTKDASKVEYHDYASIHNF